MKVILVIAALTSAISINAQISIGEKFDNVNDFCFSSDGKLLIVPINDKINIYETTNYELINEFKPKDQASISFVSLSNSGNLIASSTKDSTLIIWNLRTGKSVNLTNVKSSITTIKFSPDDEFLAIGTSDNKIIIYEPKSLKVQKSLLSHTDYITDLEYYNNDIILSCSADGSIIIWDIPNKVPLNKWKASNNWIRDISLNKSKSNIISCGDDGKINIWNIEDLNEIELIRTKKMSFSWLMSCEFYDNEIYAVGGHSKRIYIYAPKLNFRYRVQSYINKLSFLPNSDKLIIAIATQGSGLKIVSTEDMKLTD